MEIITKIIDALPFEKLAEYSFWDLAINLLIFGLLATPPFLAFWMFKREKYQIRRIQVNRRNFSIGIKREILNSVMSLAVITIIDAAIYYAQLKGYTKIYTDVNQYGWWYLGFSLVLVFFLHDALFYFIHRFMHLPGVYERVHKVHHESTDPSPFAAFSFHPYEAILQASVYVVFAFVLPMHLITLWTWQVLQVSLNVIAHLGYEIYPASFNKHWLLKFKTPSTHHNMHHEKFNGNYGLYFTWMDILFKTEFSDYRQNYDAIQSKIEQERRSKKEMAINTPPAPKF